MPSRSKCWLQIREVILNGFQLNYWCPKGCDTTASRWVKGHLHFTHCTINKILGKFPYKLEWQECQSWGLKLPCTLILPIFFLGFGATPSLVSSEVCFFISSSSDCNSTCRNLQIYYFKSKHKVSKGKTMKMFVLFGVIWKVYTICNIRESFNGK